MQRPRWGVRELALPVATMAAVRLITLFTIAVHGRTRGQGLDHVLRAWDGNHYIELAMIGYPKDLFVGTTYTGPNLAFYPLYPGLLRAVHDVTGLTYPHAGALLGFVFSLAVAALLWVLAADWAGAGVANRTVLLFAAFPGAYVLNLLYAEGLMWTLALGTLIALSRKRWVAAGLLAAACTATRPNAIVIVLCCAWAAFTAVRERREWPALIAPALAPLGAVAFHVYLWQHTGDRLAWYHAQRDGWEERFSLISVVDFVRFYLKHPTDDFQGMFVLSCTVAVIAAIVLLVRDKPPPTLLIWAAGVVFLVVTSKNLGLRPRFVSTAFPLFVPVARRLHDVALGAAVTALGVLTGLLVVITESTRVVVP